MNLLTVIPRVHPIRQKLILGEWVIDSVALSSTVGAGDYVSALGWMGADFDKLLIAELLLQQPTRLADSRVPLFICQECGLLDCGTITAKITKQHKTFIWAEFGMQNDSGVIHNLNPPPGPFNFNATQYFHALRGFRSNSLPPTH